MWEISPPQLKVVEFQQNNIPLFEKTMSMNYPLEPNPRDLDYNLPALFPLNPQTQEFIKRLNLLSFKYKDYFYNLDAQNVNSSSNSGKKEGKLNNQEEINLDDLDDLDEQIQNEPVNNVGIHKF